MGETWPGKLGLVVQVAAIAFWLGEVHVMFCRDAVKACKSYIPQEDSPFLLPPGLMWISRVASVGR